MEPKAKMSKQELLDFIRENRDEIVELLGLQPALQPYPVMPMCPGMCPYQPYGPIQPWNPFGEIMYTDGTGGG